MEKSDNADNNKEAPREGRMLDSTRSTDSHHSNHTATSSSAEPDSSTSEANSEEQSRGSSPSEGGGQPQDNLLQKKWEEMFKRLVKYKEKNGDCLVPNRYPADPQLGNWVSTQRRQYKVLENGAVDSTPMTRSRARRLERIGFKWSTKDPRHVPWMTRYQELVDFKEKYGHSQVPIGWEENIQLSNWVSTQRQEYKLLQKGRSSRLTNERMDLLNKVDFIWEAQRGGPRRRRKATVQVPPRANPVEGVGPRAAKRPAYGTTIPQAAAAQGFDQGFPMIANATTPAPATTPLAAAAAVQLGQSVPMATNNTKPVGGNSGTTSTNTNTVPKAQGLGYQMPSNTNTTGSVPQVATNGYQQGFQMASNANGSNVGTSNNFSANNFNTSNFNANNNNGASNSNAAGVSSTLATLIAQLLQNQNGASPPAPQQNVAPPSQQSPLQSLLSQLLQSQNGAARAPQQHHVAPPAAVPQQHAAPPSAPQMPWQLLQQGTYQGQAPLPPNALPPMATAHYTQWLAVIAALLSATSSSQSNAAPQPPAASPSLAQSLAALLSSTGAGASSQSQAAPPPAAPVPSLAQSLAALLSASAAGTSAQRSVAPTPPPQPQHQPVAQNSQTSTQSLVQSLAALLSATPGSSSLQNNNSAPAPALVQNHQYQFQSMQPTAPMRQGPSSSPKTVSCTESDQRDSDQKNSDNGDTGSSDGSPGSSD